LKDKNFNRNSCVNTRRENLLQIAQIFPENQKNQLSPVLYFLCGLRITVTPAGKSIHAYPGPHFFLANSLILISSGF